MHDAVVAEQLARALAGEPTGVDEADRLARLLREAVLPARFVVTPDETERALARLPRTRARSSSLPRRAKGSRATSSTSSSRSTPTST